MTYPNYIISVKADSEEHIGAGKNYVKAWRHGPYHWLVEKRDDGIKTATKTLSDVWEAADYVVRFSRELYLSHKLPEPEGLRLVSRIEEYLKKHK